jgi:DNA-binding MarR family transcriptional regulator
MTDLTPYTDENYDPTDSIGRLLTDASVLLNNALDIGASNLGISSAQYIILMRIASGQARTASELCRCGRYDTGSMTRMLDRLERKGLVKRVRSAEDRRVVELHLTDAARALYPKLPPIAVRVLNHHLRGFSGAEVATLKGFLERILANGAPA